MSTFGNFFNQIGLGAKETEAMSKSFVQASVDLGSFHNAAPTDVMDALSAATRGEYDSLQKFIPTINAARVEMEAMRQTGKASAKELTDADKARAVSSLVMKGQGKAAGDFARTQGSLANQTKILKAQFENVKATIGAKLLPIATQAVTFFNANMLPALKALGDFIKNTVVPAISSLVGWFKRYQDIIVPIAAGIGAMVLAWMAYQKIVKTIIAVKAAWIAVQAALNIVMAANPIGILVLALVGLGVALVVAYKKSETFRNIVNGAFNAIKTGVTKAVNAVKSVVTSVWNFIKNTTTSVFNGIRAVAVGVWNGIKSTITNAISGARNTVSGVVTSIRNTMTNAWNAAKTATSRIWEGIKDAVSAGVRKVVGAADDIKAKVMGVFRGAGTWLYETGRNVIQGMINGIKNMAGALVNAAKGVVTGAINSAKNLLGINSPSRVFAQIGKYTVEGLAVGLGDSRSLAKVKRASTGLTGAIESGFKQPDFDMRSSGSGSGVTYQINVTAGVGDPVEIARQIQKTLDIYNKAGGRRKAA